MFFLVGIGGNVTSFCFFPPTSLNRKELCLSNQGSVHSHLRLVQIYYPPSVGRVKVGWLGVEEVYPLSFNPKGSDFF